MLVSTWFWDVSLTCPGWRACFLRHPDASCEGDHPIFPRQPKPRSQPAKLPPSSSLGKIEIHRPPGFETQPNLQPSHFPQHNANPGSDFRRHPRSQTLCRRRKREITIRPANHLPVPISPATLAPLGLSHRPGLSSVWTA